MEKIQLMGTQNIRRRTTDLHFEVEALRRAMKRMLQHSSCQSSRTDCKDLITMTKESQAWPSLATELEAIKTSKICFSDFKISHTPRAQNGISDSLGKITILFHRELCYIGCSISIWLPRPPQV